MSGGGGFKILCVVWCVVSYARARNRFIFVRSNAQVFRGLSRDLPHSKVERRPQHLSRGGRSDGGRAPHFDRRTYGVVGVGDGCT